MIGTFTALAKNYLQELIEAAKSHCLHLDSLMTLFDLRKVFRFLEAGILIKTPAYSELHSKDWADYFALNKKYGKKYFKEFFRDVYTQIINASEAILIKKFTLSTI